MELWAQVAFVAAIISVISAVISVWYTSRGSDAELQTDVEELALLVERMAKAQRREKMARVRQGAGTASAPVEGSEGAPQPPLDFEPDPKARKAELRRRMMRSKMQ